jgi:hypothetical protein
MKFIKVKVFFLAVSFFSFSAIFAQDSTSHPKTDSSKAPKHDSTSMIQTPRSSNALTSNVTEITAFIGKNENKVEAKKEEKVS